MLLRPRISEVLLLSRRIQRDSPFSGGLRTEYMKLNVSSGYRIDHIKIWGMSIELRGWGEDRDRPSLSSGPPLTSTQGEGEEGPCYFGVKVGVQPPHVVSSDTSGLRFVSSLWDWRSCSHSAFHTTGKAGFGESSYRLRVQILLFGFCWSRWG